MEEGNSNRDCRVFARLAEAGFDIDDELLDFNNTQTQPQSQNADSTSAENSPEQGTNRRSRHRNSSHSRSRSRHSRRHCLHHYRPCGYRFKHRECNFAAAVCSMLAIVLICTSMAEPRWFHIISDAQSACNSLGISQFFSWEIEERAGKDLQSCVNMEAIQVLKVIIVMCFVAILLSLVGFFLDLTGPTSPLLKATRVNAVFSLLTVVCCVIVVGLCYWVSEIVAGVQLKNLHGHRVSVQFDVSFYLMTAAGAICVVGSACNLLRNQRRQQTESPDRYRLLGDYDGMEPAQLTPDYYAPMLNIPPPPAYTP